MTDLLIGSDIGLWALRRVKPSEVGLVYAIDPSLREAAAALGYATDRYPRAEAIHRGTRAVSVHYPRILDERVLDRYSAAYNLHPSYLPWGRGWWAVTWAIWDGEPAGASLHRMTASVDDGPIVARLRVKVISDDTGATLLARVRQVERSLFDTWWPHLSSDTPIPEEPQPPGGSFHSREDVADLRRRLSDMSERDADRLRRALTFADT